MNDKIANDPNALRQLANELRKKADAAEAEAEKVQSAQKVSWTGCTFVECVFFQPLKL
ncbi:MAG TPA: hypothetical protein VN414_04780 [Methanosarcina sp.]|nr:hypothetical protein [Methanosarcina sp.]